MQFDYLGGDPSLAQDDADVKYGGKFFGGNKTYDDCH